MSALAVIALSLWFGRAVVGAFVEPTSMDELGELIKRKSPVLLLLNLLTTVTFIALAIWVVAA
jgi:hypothetical protein